MRRCANCGNENPVTLFDEGDTFYCQVCKHRTQTATGQDDLITCPFCGRLRNRKAYACMWCNTPLDAYPPPSQETFEELDELLNEFEDKISDDDLRYGKLKGKKKR